MNRQVQLLVRVLPLMQVNAVIINFLLLVCSGGFVGCRQHFKEKIVPDHTPESGALVNAMAVDSAALINDLYKGHIRYEGKNFSAFTYSHQFHPKKKTVIITAEMEIDGHHLAYVVELFDQVGSYAKAEFSYSDNSFEYIRSYFSIDGRQVELTDVAYSNKNEKTPPSVLWYGSDFGIAGKHYTIEGRDIFLIRGLDFYCNGNQCQECQFFVLQIQNEKPEAKTFYCHGFYPYSLENADLFHDADNAEINLFLPKDERRIQSVSDFLIYKLKP